MSDIIMNKSEESIGYLGVTNAFGSLGNIKAMDVLPPLIGGTVAVAGTLFTRKFGKTRPALVQYAPLIGAGAGILGSIPLYWWRGPRAVISGAVTAAVLGGGLFAFERLSGTAYFSGIGMHQVKRLRGMRGTHIVTGAPGANVPATAKAPGGFDLTGFAATPT